MKGWKDKETERQREKKLKKFKNGETKGTKDTL